MEEIIKSYKGFNKDMTCKGKQYAEGETFTEDDVKCCDQGMHACEYPLDCFSYYEPANSIYHEVEQSGKLDRKSDDTKVASTIMKVGARLDIRGLVRAAIEYTKSRTTTEYTDPDMATAGDSGAATAGNYGAATSRGRAASGENGLSVARGNDVRVKGGVGAVLVITEENRSDYRIKEWKTVVVDGEQIKADTWYKLKDGEFVECGEEDE